MKKVGIGGALTGLSGLSGMVGGADEWTPALPTSDGGLLPHTWHYAGSGALYQDAAKTTPAVADSDPVGASVNQGSDTHDVSQATAGNRPILKLSIKNSQSVFRFDGTDSLAGTFNAGSAQPNTLFLVMQLDASVVNDNNYRNAIDGIAVGFRHTFSQYAQAPPPNKWALVATSAIKGSDTSASWLIVTILANTASSEFWLNGISDATGDIGAGSLTGLTIGSNFAQTGAFWKGDIPEVLIYTANLSNADKTEVQNYLATKYDITVTPF